MRFNIGKVFLIGFGFFGIAIIWGLYNAFVPVFLSQKFSLDVRWIGLFMTLDNIAAILVQPVIGAWSDRLRTPIGRRIPFILVGAPVGVVAFGLIPIAAALPLFVACTATLILSMAFWRIPITALMPDITPSPYRSQANGILNLMYGMGGLLAFVVGARLFEAHPAYPFWAGSGLVIVAGSLVMIFIREPKESSSSGKVPGLWTSVIESLREKDKCILRFFIAICFWNLSYATVEAFYNLYAINHLGLSAANGTRLLGEASVMVLLFSLPAGYLGSWLGRRRTVIMGMVIAIASFLVGFFLPPATLLEPLANLPMLGVVLVPGTHAVLVPAGALIMFNSIGWAFIVINTLPMMMDIGHPDRLGAYTGLYYMFAQFSAIISPNINGWIISLMGNNYNYILVSAPFFLLIALIMVIGVKRGEAVKSEIVYKNSSPPLVSPKTTP